MRASAFAGLLLVLFGVTSIGHQQVSQATGHGSGILERRDGPIPAQVYVSGAAIAVGVGLVVGGPGRAG